MKTHSPVVTRSQYSSPYILPLLMSLYFFSIRLILIGASLSCVSDMPATVLVSAHTPGFLREQFQQFWPQCPYRQLLVSSAADLDEASSGLWVDVLANTMLSWSVKESLGSGASLVRAPIQGNQADYAVREDEMAALELLIKWIGVTRLCTFAAVHSAVLVNEALKRLGIEGNIIEVSGEPSRASLVELVKKQVKPEGFNSFLILLPPVSALQLLQALSAGNLGLRSTVVFLGQYTAMGLLRRVNSLPLGFASPLFLVAEGCEWTSNEAQLILCQALQPAATTVFSILCITEDGGRHLGAIRNETITSQLPSALQGSTAVVASMAEVRISFNNGTLNPSCEAGTFEPPLYFGLNLALAHIEKAQEILPHHKIVVQNLTLGLYDFDLGWAMQQLSQVPKENLGVVMVPGGYSSTAIGVYDMLLSMNITLPQVGINTASQFSSMARYPLYTRLNVPNSYSAILYLKMIQHFGWKRIVVLFSPDDVWSNEIYGLFVTKAKELGITIANAEKNRGISSGVTNYTTYMGSYEEIVALKVRITVLILYGEALIQSLKALYDLGIRGGDLLFLAVEWLQDALFSTQDAKITEMCSGAIAFVPATNVGEVGEEAAREYKSVFGKTMNPYACLFYDVGFAVAYGIDLLLQTGGDIQNAAALNQAIRKSHFAGCSGVVLIEPGTNDRAPGTFNIYNLHVNADGSHEIVVVGTFNPLGTVLFNFTEDIRWPDNSTTVPTDTITSDIDCPFMSKEVVAYLPGAIVSYISLVVLALLTIGITMWIWRRKWNLPAAILAQQVEISFEDYLFFASIGIEALQYADKGQVFPYLIIFLSRLIDFADANMTSLLDLKNGVYWAVLQGAFCVVGLWAIFWIVIVFDIDKKVKWIFPTIRTLGEKSLPVIGDLCWLPLVSILIDVFQCPDAVNTGESVSFKDTFLQQDCYQHCWTSPHSYYTLGALLALLLYVPLSVYLRPTLQDKQLYLHIHIAPAYVMLKTLYQITIIVLDKTVGALFGVLHAFLFIGVTAVFFALTVWKKPYGYGRANLWHYASLLGVLWYSTLSTLALVGVGGPAVMWLCLFAGGEAVIVVAALIWQIWKVPSFLYSPKGIRVVDLFKFMFTRAGQYMTIIHEPREHPADRAVRISFEFEQVKLPTISRLFESSSQDAIQVSI